MTDGNQFKCMDFLLKIEKNNLIMNGFADKKGWICKEGNYDVILRRKAQFLVCIYLL